MAKGQMKSNKEAKKPKAEKAKAGAGGDDLTQRLGAAQAAAKDKGKAGKK